MTEPTLAPPPVPWRAVLLTLALVAFVLVTVASLSGEWASLFSRDSAQRMAAFFASFFPPALDPPFLARVARGTLETLAISLLGTLLATIAGVVLALPAAGPAGSIARRATRLALNVLRAVPELVWAALIVISAGLGPFAGVLALAVHTTGVLGRLFADALENAPADASRALRTNGATTVATFWYATLPQLLPQFVSYALYRWENNIRAASVLGLVGAGGLGQLLYFHLSLFQMHEASTVILAVLVLVGIVDAASYRIRTQLA